MLKRSRFLSVILMACLLSSQAYAEDSDINWGYKGKRGPEHWGEIDKKFSVCSMGKIQSPINIPESDVKNAPFSLTVNYEPAPLIIVEDGETELTIGNQREIIRSDHDVQVKFPKKLSQETIKFAGNEYRLVQFHMHTPSENKLHGRNYPMEIHFVHQGEGGKLAVIGVFVKYGAENPTLQKIISNIPEEEHQAVMIKGANINPKDLLPAKKDYYSFTGSLTTPPCSEGLQWIQMAEPISASPKQIAAIREASDGMNARPIQALNQRDVFYSKSP